MFCEWGEADEQLVLVAETIDQHLVSDEHVLAVEHVLSVEPHVGEGCQSAQPKEMGSFVTGIRGEPTTEPPALAVVIAKECHLVAGVRHGSGCRAWDLRGPPSRP
jgi:hypothetical protein